MEPSSSSSNHQEKPTKSQGKSKFKEIKGKKEGINKRSEESCWNFWTALHLLLGLLGSYVNKLGNGTLALQTQGTHSNSR